MRRGHWLLESGSRREEENCRLHMRCRTSAGMRGRGHAISMARAESRAPRKYVHSAGSVGSRRRCFSSPLPRKMRAAKTLQAPRAQRPTALPCRRRSVPCARAEKRDHRQRRAKPAGRSARADCGPVQCTLPSSAPADISMTSLFSVLDMESFWSPFGRTASHRQSRPDACSELGRPPGRLGRVSPGGLGPMGPAPTNARQEQEKREGKSSSEVKEKKGRQANSQIGHPQAEKMERCI